MDCFLICALSRCAMEISTGNPNQASVVSTTIYFTVIYGVVFAIDSPHCGDAFGGSIQRSSSNVGGRVSICFDPVLRHVA